jgi:hypothetical protein
MLSLPAINQGKSSGRGLTQQDFGASLFCQSARKGVPVGHAPKTLLQKLGNSVYVKRLACLSKYCDSKSD